MSFKPPPPDGPVGADAPDLSPLSVLGIDARQERLYRVVLRGSGQRLGSLASSARLPLVELREHLTRLHAVGLVEVRGDVVTAHPPQVALARLIGAESRRVQNRREQLEAARGLLPSLTADHLAASVTAGEQVALEVLSGGDIAQVIRNLSADSSGELLWLRPDPWNTHPSNDIDDWVIELIRSGRRSRAVYSVQVLRECPELIRRRAEAGEHVRVLLDVPTRLAVLGTSAALMSERFGVYDDRRVLLRQHSLVAATTLMFEGVWDRALPVPGLEHPEAGPSGHQQLVEQLASGAKDEQIARALGISVRTVRRRVAELLVELGADSRFQAGVEAVRRGWV
jgi:DNA-binding NarL/FixJ family response regulator